MRCVNSRLLTYLLSYGASISCCYIDSLRLMLIGWDDCLAAAADNWKLEEITSA